MAGQTPSNFGGRGRECAGGSGHDTARNLDPDYCNLLGSGQERTEVGLGAILGAPVMLSTLVLPILAMLLMLYARLGKRSANFKLNYKEVKTDLVFFLLAYSLALGCVFLPSRALHVAVAIALFCLYIYYMRLKFSSDDEETEPGVDVDPLVFSPGSRHPSFVMIALQGAIGLIGLVAGAHLFVTAAKSLSAELSVSPLLLALLIAPLATELPEMSNSFLWLYKKKDRLAVGNVTGAMVFQGTFPVSVGLLLGYRMDAGFLRDDDDGTGGGCHRRLALCNSYGAGFAPLAFERKRAAVSRVFHLFL